MSSLAKRLIKAAGNEYASTLGNSLYGIPKDLCYLSLYVARIMFTGSIKKQFTSGITQIVGDSRTFKSLFALMIGADYLRQHPDAVLVIFDCEFGIMEYAKKMGLDPNRVVHLPFTSIGALKTEFTRIIEDAKPDEKIFFIVDSISMVASKREIENAESGNEAADMTRAKDINSLFRIITPILNLKSKAAIFINNAYSSITNAYAEDTIKGGKQSVLSSHNIFTVSRSQEKDTATKELLGYSFNYTAYKSRKIVDKSKFSIVVGFDEGINKYAGLFDIAMDVGFIISETKGFYKRKYVENDKNWRFKDTHTDEFWMPLIDDPAFDEAIQDRYSLSGEALLRQLDKQKAEAEAISDDSDSTTNYLAGDV